MALTGMVSSCDKFKDDSDIDYTEANKEIGGSWQIVKATRNGVDITKMMDFSGFRLNLNNDNSFSIDNYLPFLVDGNGTWEVNDPQYPFRLIFKRSDSAEPVISALNYPIVNGKRQISLTFSPGCYSNMYTYVFEKVSN